MTEQTDAPGAPSPTPAPTSSGLLGRLRRYVTGHDLYLRWRLRNPAGSFASTYVRGETARLDRGLAHPTLGKLLRDPERFRVDGEMWLEMLKAYGMQPHHTLVDYGCGSLRVGRMVMAMLDPGNYWGIDVTDRFYKDGLESIDPALIAAKKPHLAVIGGRVLARLARLQPDFVILVGVLHHVPLADLQPLLDRLAGIMGPRSTLIIHFLESEEYAQISSFVFRHTLADVEGAVAAAGLQSSLVQQGPWIQPEQGGIPFRGTRLVGRKPAA